jgi:hypothetical protein
MPSNINERDNINIYNESPLSPPKRNLKGQRQVNTYIYIYNFLKLTFIILYYIYQK